MSCVSANSIQPGNQTEGDAAAPALLTLLELAMASPDVGRRLAESLPPEFIPDTPLGRALNLAISAALNDEMDALPGELQNLLLETPSPEVSKALVRPTRFQSAGLTRALNEAVRELHRLRRDREQYELLGRIRAAASPEERLKLLAELQKLNVPAGP